MEKPKEFNIDTIFKNDIYTIPLYQRNYAWGEAQVVQLIQDIWDYACLPEKSNYYIGTLVVHKRTINKIDHYETIDGQQRLTTINILLSVLKNEFKTADISSGYEIQLRFQSRPLSSASLKSLADNGIESGQKFNSKMHQAYLDMSKMLKELFKDNGLKEEIFVKYLFKNVILLRVEVPADTDLNHYFEIMNNRGEQLEKHEILKAEFLLHLKDEPQESEAFSMIWDACSNMEKYIQYGFQKKIRDAIFNEKTWDEIPNDFESFVKLTINDNKDKTPDLNSSFLEIAKGETITIGKEAKEEDDSDVQFNSVVSFPNFLLHVLRVLTKNNIPLDDKRLIRTFKLELDKRENLQTKKEFVKEFAYSLLKCKFLFDKYIIKKEYKSNSEHWSLKSIKLGEKQKRYYSNTFVKEIDNKQLTMLLSMFHVSFPQTTYKHWLSGTLNFLFDTYNKCIDEENYIAYLESMCDAFYFDQFGKIKMDYYDIIYKNSSKSVSTSINIENLNQGTNVQNFIFNRLDYLLWKSITIEKNESFNIENINQFEFSFRSSVEHFFPQHPKQGADLEIVSKEILDNFGNLCLISRSKNSELSNYSPKAKAEHYSKSTAIESLKQQLMIQEKDKWDGDSIIKHQEKMIAILNTLS